MSDYVDQLQEDLEHLEYLLNHVELDNSCRIKYEKDYKKLITKINKFK